MKKQLLKLVMLACIFIGVGAKTMNAQSGDSCTTAKDFLPDTSMVPQVEIMSNGTVWYKFTAIDSNLTIKLVELFSSPGNKVLSVKVRIANCSNPSIIASDTITDLYDSALVITTTLLDSGSVYYLEITKNNSTEEVKMLIVVDNNPKINWGCTVPPQCEYVFNGDFEDYLSVPTGGPNQYNPGQIFRTCNWSTANIGTPDYFMTIAPANSNFGVPNNVAGAGAFSINSAGTTPSGGAYGGINAWWGGQPAGLSECIQGNLVCPLTAGVNYIVSFYVHQASFSHFTVPMLGAAITNGSIATATVFAPVPPAGSVIAGGLTSTNNWQLITGVYCATGGEDHITIGDFWPLQPPIPNGFGQAQAAYYYIDGISVSPMPLAVTTSTICSGETPVLNNNYCGAQMDWTSTYPWSCAACIDPNPSLPFLSSSESFTATLTLCDGCVQTSTAVVTVAQPPVIIITGSITSCTGAGTVYTALQLGVTQSPVTYSWTASNGASQSGTSNTFTPGFSSAGGTIYCTITNAATGCKGTASLYVGSCCEPPTPNINFTNTAVNVLPGSLAANSMGTWNSSTYEVKGKTFSINGTFTVNMDLTLMGCTVLMGYGTTINISPGKKLIITDLVDPTLPWLISHLYACKEMWSGINVIYSNSSLLIDHGTTIEDAETAVFATNGGDVTIGGYYNQTGQLKVIFNKNLKNVVINNSGTHVYTTNTITATDFECIVGQIPQGGSNVNGGNFLMFPHANIRPDVGVDLNMVNNITIGSAASANLLNKFENMDYGIRSDKSNLIVYNNLFQDITMPQNIFIGSCLPGTAICAKGNISSNYPPYMIVGSSSAGNYINTFNNCGVGIDAGKTMNQTIWENHFNNIKKWAIRENTNLTCSIVIAQNHIVNAQIGIDCFNSLFSYVDIYNNDITNSGGLANVIGINVNEPTPSPTGYYRIHYNNINYVRSGILANGLTGSNIDRNNIRITPTTINNPLPCYGVKVDNSRKCNVVANWVLGTTIDRWVYGIDLNSVCSSNQVTCNESHTVGRGLFFGGNQLPGTLIAKNMMDNNLEGFVINGNNGQVGPQSSFFGVSCDNTWSPNMTFNTANYGNAPGNLSILYVRTPCGTPYCPSPWNMYPGSLLYNIPQFVAASNLSYTCPVVLHPFANAATHAMLLKIAGDSIPVEEYDSATIFMMHQNLYRYLASDSTFLTNDSLLQSFVQEMNEGNLGKLDSIERMFAKPATMDTTQLLSLLALVNSITASSSVEANSAWLYKQMLTNLLQRKEWDSTQIYSLRDLAWKCAHTDGAAVLQARAILSQLDTVEYYNICELGDELTPKIHWTVNQPTKRNSFKLFPNPNNGQMNLIYSLSKSDKGELNLYDLRGLLIRKYSLQSGENNQLFINESELGNGVYFYKVMVNDELKSSDKIVIIK